MNKDVSIKKRKCEMKRRCCKKTELKATVRSLEMLNQECNKKMSENNKISGKYVTRMVKQVTTKYLGSGLAVGYRILKWGSKETFELDPSCEQNLKNRINRAEVVSENGAKV